MMVVVDIEPGIEMDLAEFKNDLEETGTDDGRNGVKIRTYSRWYFDCVDLKALEREKYHEKFRAELPEDKIEYIYKHRVTINFR